MFGEHCDLRTIMVEVSKCLVQVWHGCLLFVYGPGTQGMEREPMLESLVLTCPADLRSSRALWRRSQRWIGPAESTVSVCPLRPVHVGSGR